MEAAISRFLLNISHNAWAVYSVTFGVAFLESFAFIGLVVPGAVFAVTAGFIAGRGLLSLPILLASGSLGAILADLASYYLARHWGTPLLELRFLARYQPLLESGHEFFLRHGGKSVFFGRFVGPIRPVVPFLAGLLRMPSLQFWIYAVTSGILWGLAYIGGGYLFGENWYRVEQWSGPIGTGLLLVVLVAYFAKPYLRRRPGDGKRNPSDTTIPENRMDADEPEAADGDPGEMQ